MKIAIIFLVSITLLACVKDDASPFQEQKDTPLELVWKQSLEGPTGSTAVDAIILAEGVVFSSANSRSSIETFSLRDHQTGALLKKWHNPLSETVRTGPQAIHHRDKLYLPKGNDLSCLDLNNFNTVFVTERNMANIQLISNITSTKFGLFQTSKVFRNSSNSFEGQILEIEELSGTLDTLRIIKSFDDYKLFLGGMVGSELPEEVLYIQVEGWHKDSVVNGGRFSVLAYELKSDSILWQTPYTKNQQPMRRPLYQDGRVYAFSSNIVHCLDATSGAELWRYQLNGPIGYNNFSQGGARIYKDLLICKPNHEVLFALNRFSGQIEWSNNHAGSAGFGGVNLYDGKFMYADGTLYIHHAETGKILLQESSYGKLTETPVVDSINGHLYLNNYIDALCFRWPSLE